jgi:hypothetical protein
MIEIIIVPAANGRYRAILDRRELIISAREPFFAAARKLLAEGVYPNMPICMRHEGSKTRSLTSTVGKAAKLAVMERDNGGAPTIIKWKPSPFDTVRAPVENNDETLPGQRAAE